MAAIFLVVSLVCGGLLAACSVKLLTDAGKGSSFLWLTPAKPHPAIAGIVAGVLVVLCALVVFLQLSSKLTDLDDKFERSEGELTSEKKKLKVANDDMKTLRGERDAEKAKLAEARKETGKLKKELDAKEEESVVGSEEAGHLKQRLTVVTGKLEAERKRAQTYAAERDIAKETTRAKEREIEKLKAAIEVEKQFRRDFTALVEEEEAKESSLSGRALRMYTKLRALRSRYKE